MRIFRCFALAVLSTLVAGAFVTGPAAADTAEAFLGSAAGRALNLELLGQKATFGTSSAKATSTLTAVAEGAGQLLQPNSTAATSASGNNTKQESGQKCATPTLPGELAAIVNIGLACSSSVSEVTNGAPHAVSEGSVASLDLNVSTILNAVPNLNQTIDQVQEALTPVLGAVDQATAALGLTPSDTVGDLVDALQATQTLAVRLGKSVSDVSTAAQTVTSAATAAGAQIDVLPLGGLAGGPVASIIVGDAKASAVYDRATGKSTAAFDPALVRVRLGLTGLGAEPVEIPLAPGQDITILNGTPLESTIKLGAGSTATAADGTVTSVADGVSLYLLKGINESAVGAMDGGIRLELAHAEAAVAGAPAQVTPVSPQVEAPRELPRTGGFPWLPVAGTGLVLAAIVTRRLAFGR